MSGSPEQQIRLLHGLEGLQQLAPDWKKLADRNAARHYCQSFQWLQCCIEALESDPSMDSFGALYENGEIQMILPLRRVPRKVFGMTARIFQLPAHPEIPVCDLIAADSSRTGAQLWDLLRGLSQQHGLKWDSIRLPRILEDSCASAAIAALPEVPLIRSSVMRSDFLVIQPYEEMFGEFSKNFRSNLRKARNKLAALSNVEFVTARTEPELIRSFQEFVQVEASGWKGAQGSGTAIASDERLTKFYKQVIRCFASEGGSQGACEINLLRHDGRCIAGQFAVIWNDTCHLLKIGYDQQYAHEAPGNMLLEHLCKRYENDPIIKRIHLISDAPWHTSWNPQSEGISTVHLFNTTLAGRRAYWGMKLEQALTRK